MKKEFSAGGILFKKQETRLDSARQARNKKQEIVWLVCQHSQHKGWVFPKGFIGDKIAGESIEDTALREVEEETGVKGKILEKLEKPAGYFYVWEGEKRFKTVYYFLMEFVSGDINNHDFEMMKVEWWSKEKVEKELTYKSDKLAFKEALKLLL